MKYFSRELNKRYTSQDDGVARAADAEWEVALEHYQHYLESIETDLPEHIREFTNLLLHDAIIWLIARQGDNLLMVMQKDIPPRDMVILTYTLLQEPVIDKGALPLEDRGAIMDFQYDEFELVREEGRITFAQSIVFGNGWEMSLRFSDVQVTLAKPVYLSKETRPEPVPESVTAESG